VAKTPKIEKWEVQQFQSGTVIVLDVNGEFEDMKGDGKTLLRNIKPHFYVYGPGGENEDMEAANRVAVAIELAKFMNHEIDRPRWMNDMELLHGKNLNSTRDAPHLESLDGTQIIATGPMVDAAPPKLQWVEDTSTQAILARAGLIRRVASPKQWDDYVRTTT